ncbi:LysR family transcriptional regulator [Burkholderia sp. Leaf177]|uniref:LysR substrate-binding domain-containing protein n=1 Tax=Burkholderia sp. Leaf177 TaxID=1736287 RepID=UPI0006FD2B1A|nr:LysR substrate-binding domain-containing protein [Burkholderia sp. Leaf177]KQR77096.1 LysR family transcriptional regulator [Burkholderia sp. Leaf177]
MQLNPRQLEAFRKVMVTGSMTIAAEMLKISQPAVSRLIKDFEQTLQVRLFRREGNRLIPGAEARRLFSEVDRFYQGIERVERVAQDLKTLRAGTLRIGSMTTLGLSVLTEGVRRFSHDRPGVTTSLDMRNSLSILELTAANQFDIGFVHIMGNEYPGVDIIPFTAVEAVCMLPSTHPLARKKVIKISDLQGQPLISLSPNNPLRMRLEMAMDGAGVTCERPVETTLAPSACSMAAGGLGLTVIDLFSATYAKYPGAVFRRLEPPIPFEVSMVLPAHQPRSRIVTDFMHVMRELIKQEFIPQIDGKIRSRKSTTVATS